MAGRLFPSSTTAPGSDPSEPTTTPEEMAEQLGVSVATMRSALWRSRIKPGPGAAARSSQLDRAAWLRREYVGRRRRMTSIAEGLGTSVATVRAALVTHGIPLRPRDHYQRRLRPPPWLGQECA